ncbi:unnamed protein product [Arabidopsis lyrata]|uniref:Predicted protein n=1 Tax=Arabidopsis lyrata subsp. lyrata TaxID=81972 RepID=D7KKR7_ARALL|nr:predicted protein [Arabidopsis lyrata subsp. lyrata]CAH8251819.1 unnamed protein product [Arabidopsis lyrata]
MAYKDEAPKPQLSMEEAGRRARSKLSRGEAEGSGVRGRGGRGGGRGAISFVIIWKIS